MRRRASGVVPALLLVVFLALPALSATGQLPQLNDLFVLGKGEGQEPAKAPVQTNPEPPLVATPRADCVSGGKREPGIQGRVPEGSNPNGLSCNADVIGRAGNSGGFKVHRYVDRAGHECAFYDTALLFPTNAVRLDGTSGGVAVLDMSNPRKPVETARLTEPAMVTPHESLELNTKRGLLAAVVGNPSTYPGLVSIYDVSQDCRKPVLQSTSSSARLGHESGFSEDGNTFYATGTAMKSISAIDVTNPKQPKNIWQGNIVSHGMSLRPDGNRAYLADPDGQLVTLDTSEIQARKPDPQTREISRLTWKSASIPQNALPFTAGGKPYILEFDEYTQGTSGGGNADAVGAARIIDMSDERKPRSVAQIRLQVNQPADHAAAREDPGATSPVQGYAAHYCDLDSRVDPEGRGVLVHRLGPARVRHHRADQAEGDRLLRQAQHGADRERLRRQQLRHVQARDRRRPARGLVLRWRHRVLQRRGSIRGCGPPRRARAAAAWPGGRRSGRGTSGACGSA